MNKTKSLLILTILLISVNSIAKVDCDKNPIQCQILKNRPDIDKSYAYELSNVIYKVINKRYPRNYHIEKLRNQRKYYIPPRIFTAILMQESRYKLDAKGSYTGLRKLTELELNNAQDRCLYSKDPECLENIKRYIKTKVYTDFGIAQIHYRTIERFKFDINKLTTDLEYSVEAGAIVLADFQARYEAKESNWWTRYNSSSDEKRFIYERLVSRYL